MTSATTPHVSELRVRYGETDCMGVVYHGTYFQYFEVGRTEHLRALGRRYRDLEESGIALAVVLATARYRGSARYDDLLRVKTWVSALTHVTVTYSYDIFRVANDGSEEGPLVTGKTTLACLGPDRRPRRLPPDLAALLTSE